MRSRGLRLESSFISKMSKLNRHKTAVAGEKGVVCGIHPTFWSVIDQVGDRGVKHG